MLRNYLKIAWRHLVRDRSFSFINLAGLAVGLATCLLIAEFIASEWSANRFHQQYNHLYRAVVGVRQQEYNYSLPPGVAKVLKERVAGIDAIVRVADGIGGGVLTTTGRAPQAFREERIMYSDADFFRAFTFPFVSGTNTLDQPRTLALSATLARKVFGAVAPVGQLLTVSNQFGSRPYTVTGVFADLPATSDIQTAVVLSLASLNAAADRDGNDWADPATLDSEFTTLYLQLNEKTDPVALARQVTHTFHQLDPRTRDKTFLLQPFSALHLAPSFTYPFQTSGSLPLVTALAGVALLILLVAWINYINLSTARSLRQAKEVGVRKVVGATTGQLVGLFLTETLLVTALAVVTGVVLAAGLQPLFNSFTGKELSMGVLQESGFGIGLLAIVLGTALAAGTYVALTLSAPNPTAVLRGRLRFSGRGVSLRQGLVVFQFSISIVFIIVTVVMFRQLTFMQRSELGLTLKQLLVIAGPTVASDQQASRNASFKQELTRLPFVSKVAASNNVPGIGYNFGTNGIVRAGGSSAPGDDKKNYSMFIADHQFFDTYGITLAAGRPFTEAEANASWNNVPRVLINQRAARQLGFDLKRPVVGQKIKWNKEYEIIGVVKDYHHLSMRQPIEPVIYLASAGYSYFTIQTRTDGLPAKLAQLETLYRQTFPGNPFEYFFADEAYDRQFRIERQLGQVFVAASGVAILIACLGIFGLAAFAAQRRTKEIGVRKVLGASVASIVALLSKDFLKLVLVAIIIASPIAWYAMHRWLANFAYKTDMAWWVFALAGLLAVGIALLTVSFQSIKAALTNPVKSLRSE